MNTSELKPPNGAPKASTPAAPAKPPRMTIKNVKKGVIEVPHRVCIFGAEKCGKSTFAAGAPNPIFLGKDDGTEHLDVTRMPQPRSWREVLEAIQAILTEDHDYKTLVVDPVNWLEPMLHDEILGNSGESIEAWNGGYGRGYDAALLKWRHFVDLIARVWRRRQMNVVIVAHAKLIKFNDPKGPSFQRWGLAMANDRVSDVFRQWAESILFVQREAYGKVDEKTKRIKAAGSAAIIAHTEWTPAYDAGNRWGLPSQIPLGWREYVDAVADTKKGGATMLEQIEAALVQLANPELEKKVRDYLADPRVSVVEVWNQLSSKLGQEREQKEVSDDEATETKDQEEGEKAA